MTIVIVTLQTSNQLAEAHESQFLRVICTKIFFIFKHQQTLIKLKIKKIRLTEINVEYEAAFLHENKVNLTFNSASIASWWSPNEDLTMSTLWSPASTWVAEGSGTSTIGDQTFSVAGLHVWNALPQHLSAFCSHLRTYLVRRCKWRMSIGPTSSRLDWLLLTDPTVISDVLLAHFYLLNHSQLVTTALKTFFNVT